MVLIINQYVLLLFHVLDIYNYNIKYMAIYSDYKYRTRLIILSAWNSTSGRQPLLLNITVFFI